MKISPALLIALIGGAAAFFYFQRRAQSAPQALIPGEAPAGYRYTPIPQRWIDYTPEGYSVVGTTNRMYDFLT